MSKVRCLVCNKKISADAKSCPKCGTPKRKAVGISDTKKMLGVMIGFFCLLGGFAMYSYEMEMIEKYPRYVPESGLLGSPSSMLFLIAIFFILFFLSHSAKGKNE